MLQKIATIFLKSKVFELQNLQEPPGWFRSGVKCLNLEFLLTQSQGCHQMPLQKSIKFYSSELRTFLCATPVVMRLID